MPTVRTSTLEIAYGESGPTDGAPVLLLHGFPYSAHAYDAAAPALAAAGCRVIVPDLRGYGGTRFLSEATPRSGEQAVLGADVMALMEALGTGPAVLAGWDWGGRAACVAAAIWPERVAGLVSVGGYAIQDVAGAARPGAAEQELRWWYQYYFHTPRGVWGLRENRRGIARLLWRLWSPSWRFEEAVFERSAADWDNPDFVDVVVQSYRHRFGNAAGDPAVAWIEARLAGKPAITVPTVVLEGAEDGVMPVKEVQPGQFTRLLRREVVEGVGHAMPYERPEAIVRAVLEVMGG